MEKNLENIVNDGSRKIKIRGREAIVPLKFDEEGAPATVDRLLFKRLTLQDLRFLQDWRAAEWDTQKAIEKSGLTPEKAERLIKKLVVFREEDAKVKALAEIPTPDWIKSKHVENIYNPTLEESQQKSLSELAKIEGAYKNTAKINIQNNTFQMPVLDEQGMAELKALGDRLASVETTAESAA